MLHGKPMDKYSMRVPHVTLRGVGRYIQTNQLDFR